VATTTQKRLTVAACTTCTALVLGVFLLFTIWTPDLMKEFGMKLGPVMGIFAITGILMNVGMPIVGSLLTRIPAWRLTTFGGIVLGVGVIAASTLKSPLAFSVVYALFMGVGVAAAGILPGQTLAVRLFPNHVGALSGLMMVALAVAGATLPQIFTPLKAAIGWRAAMAVMGAMVLVLVPLLAVAFMRVEVGDEAGPAAGLHGAHGAGGKAASGPILRTWPFWIITICILPMFGTGTSIQANFVPIVGDHGVSPAQAATALSALMVGTAIGAGFFGWLADRIDPRLAILAVAMVMVAALLILVGGKGLAFASVAAFTFGAGAGGISPLMSTFALRQFKDGYAPALGLMNFFMLPYMFGPPLIGHIRDQTGSYNGVLLAIAPILVLAAAAMWTLNSAKSPVGAAAVAG
jgi:cyanate permease